MRMDIDDDVQEVFAEVYQAQSAETLPAGSPLRQSVEFGNKILMPSSALDRLSRLNVFYPMMFTVQPFKSNPGLPIPTTHCGVLEFSAPEGVVYLPPWMLRTLKIPVLGGGLVRLMNVALPLGKFIKIQPQSVDFLDITDPRAVLEHSLRSYACLTLNDIISIRYNDTIFNVKVLEVTPCSGLNGISIMETDLQVDFAAPLGYVEKSIESDTTHSSSSIAASIEVIRESTLSFLPFAGSSNRLSGSVASSLTGINYSHDSVQITEPIATNKSAEPIALPKGAVFFGQRRSIINSSEVPKEPTNEAASSFKAFSGKPNRLS